MDYPTESYHKNMIAMKAYTHQRMSKTFYDHIIANNNKFHTCMGGVQTCNKHMDERKKIDTILLWPL